MISYSPRHYSVRKCWLKLHSLLKRATNFMVKPLVQMLAETSVFIQHISEQRPWQKSRTRKRKNVDLVVRVQRPSDLYSGALIDLVEISPHPTGTVLLLHLFPDNLTAHHFIFHRIFNLILHVTKAIGVLTHLPSSSSSGQSVESFHLQEHQSRKDNPGTYNHSLRYRLSALNLLPLFYVDMLLCTYLPLLYWIFSDNCRILSSDMISAKRYWKRW